MSYRHDEHWQEDRLNMQKRLEGLREVVDEVLKDVRWGGYDICDCGHRYLQHKRLLGREVERVYDACTVEGCACIDFDDTERKWKFDAARRQPVKPLRVFDGGREDAA